MRVTTPLSPKHFEGGARRFVRPLNASASRSFLLRREW
jgi:hypothetical protein